MQGLLTFKEKTMVQSIFEVEQQLFGSNPMEFSCLMHELRKLINCERDVRPYERDIIKHRLLG